MTWFMASGLKSVIGCLRSQATLPGRVVQKDSEQAVPIYAEPLNDKEPSCV